MVDGGNWVGSLGFIAATRDFLSKLTEIKVVVCVLKTIVFHRSFQHFTCWVYNLLHPTTILVNLECRYDSHIFSVSYICALLNIDL